MVIAVTGAAGAVGQALRSRLASEPDKDARFISRQLVSGSRDYRSPDLSVASIADWMPALEGTRTLIHLAALLPSSRSNAQQMERVNISGTATLAEAAYEAGVKRFVFVSTLGVHGITSGNDPFSPQSPIAPSGPYATSKYRAEKLLMEFCSKTGMQCVIVRPPIVYGSNAGGKIARLEKMIADGQRLPFGRIDQNRRQMISVRNLADGLLLSATHPAAPGSPLLLADREAVSTHGLLAKLACLHNRPLRYLPVPRQVFKMAQNIPVLGKSVERLTGNVEVRDMRLQQQLNWVAPHSLDEELANMVQGRAGLLHGVS